MIKLILRQIFELLFKIILFFVLIYYFVEDKNFADSAYITSLFLIINGFFTLIRYLIKKIRMKRNCKGKWYELLTLTNKHKLFADEYLDLNATRSYKAAYPNTKKMKQQILGARMVRINKVAIIYNKAWRTGKAHTFWCTIRGYSKIIITWLEKIER